MPNTNQVITISKDLFDRYKKWIDGTIFYQLSEDKKFVRLFQACPSKITEKIFEEVFKLQSIQTNEQT